MAAVDNANSPSPTTGMDFFCNGGTGIMGDDLKRMNISRLSQSELMALSLSSSSTLDICRRDDDVTPQLDRSVFNESAGGRRQTYSRLHHRSYSRLPGLHPSFKSHRQANPLSDPVSHSIVHYLKHFVNGNDNPPPPPPLPSQPQEETEAVDVSLMDLDIPELQGNLEIQRGRSRKTDNISQTKSVENGVGVELQLVNDKGEKVDLAELGKNGDEIFAEELKRRTEGLETEEGALGFLSGLDGQWCSRRKKRKYVDAGVIGGALPVGWKVLLGLRRRDYRVAVYCRRLISPTGQQFMSCKDAAAFLKTHFPGMDQVEDKKMYHTGKTHVLSSEKIACPPGKSAHRKVSVSPADHNSTNPRDVDQFTGIEDLPEVQVKDIFECSKCKLTFDDKDVYMKHLLSSHQKTTKRYRFGRPVGEGVIIKDGKFECQFCHKVFDEKRSYSGHVGIHVRNSGKNSSELANLLVANKITESVSQEPVPSMSSKMDALVEIVQNSSFTETPAIGTAKFEIPDPSPVMDCLENSALPIENAAKMGSDSVEIHEDDVNASKAMIEDLNQCREVIMETNDMVRNDFEWHVMNVEMDASCIDDSVPSQSHEIEKFGSISFHVGDENRSFKRTSDDLENTQSLTVEDIEYQGEGSSVPLVQSFQFFPPFSSSKGQDEFSVVDQKLDNVTGFEELRFDDIEPYSFGHGQDLTSLAGGSMNLGDETGIELGFNTSVRFGSDTLMLNTVHTNQ